MAMNYIQSGDTLTIPAPAAVTSGGVVIAGSIVGIAAETTALGALVDVHTRGVFSVPKVGTDVVTLGAPIYWNAGSSLATVTAGSNAKLGVAVEAAGNGVATVKIKFG